MNLKSYLIHFYEFIRNKESSFVFHKTINIMFLEYHLNHISSSGFNIANPTVGMHENIL